MSKIPLCKVVATIPCQDFAFDGPSDAADAGDAAMMMIAWET